MNGLPNPPTTWQEARTAEGKVYYYNSATRATQWNKPVELQTPQERALSQQAWKEYSTPEGRKYYSNSETKETTWHMPEAYKNALAQVPAVPVAAPAPTFVAGGVASMSSYSQEISRDTYTPQDRRESDRKDYGSTNGIHVPSATTEQAPDFSSFEEAESAFLKLLRRLNVQPDWTWEQTMRATIRDPYYRALKDPKDRKAAFEKYAVEVRQQEKERAKERLAKLRADFNTMLKSHAEIKHYSRWKTVRPIIERETIFRSTDSEDERKQLFEEYMVELQREHMESEAVTRKAAMTDLISILKDLDLEPYTRWSEAQGMIQGHERFASEDEFRTLSKSDVLTAFENHIKSLERTFNDARQQEKASRTRRERQNRDRFMDLLMEMRSQGKIKAGTKWMAILPEIEHDARYVSMLGQSGSTPLDLFWDLVEEEERALRGRRNDVYDVLEDQRYEVTQKTKFEDFYQVMLSDRRTADIDPDALQLIFDRLFEKVVKRTEDEKHAADRHQRRAIDALRSRIKHLEPPVRVTDTWEDVRPRLERLDEYRALESDDLRVQAYEKVVKRLKEKDEDADKDRDRRRSRRGEDRDHRNGHRADPRRGRLSKTPETDAYEADRRRAMAEREKQYRKASSLGLSPPPASFRDRDRDRKDERHGRLERERERERERAAPVRTASGYERERRDRDAERERLYRTRTDPRDELNYGEEVHSVTGSDRRRRRGGESDGESADSSRRSAKRYRKEGGRPGSSRDRDRDRDRRRTKTPEAVKKDPTALVPPPSEPAGVHSGSEEGEIEED